MRLYDCYRSDDIKAKLEESKTGHEALLKAWENVTYNVKKDGTPFKVMAKNISGARYCREEYSDCAGENELRVSTKVNGKYYFDSIHLYKNANDITEETKRNKTENYMDATKWRRIYCYDLDDIKDSIQQRIESLKSSIAEDKKQLEVVEEAYKTFEDMFSEALDALENITGDKNRLYAMVKDTITSNKI